MNDQQSGPPIFDPPPLPPHRHMVGDLQSGNAEMCLWRDGHTHRLGYHPFRWLDWAASTPEHVHLVQVSP